MSGAHISTQGLVLREVNYKEADKILTIPRCKGSSLDPSSHGKSTWKVGYDATIPMDADRSLYSKATLE